MRDDLHTARWVARGTPEWDGMWRGLAQHPLNIGWAPPTVAAHRGEVWPYMGTTARGHSFRHRCHPRTGRRESVTIPIDPAEEEPACAS